jgi:hypothetical protein
MLRIDIRQVQPGHSEQLRQWFHNAGGSRRAEALATLKDEGCRHQQAILIEGKDGPLLMYIMEVEDVEQSRQAVRTSRHAIDADHRRLLQEAVGGQASYEVLLDLHQ